MIDKGRKLYVGMSTMGQVFQRRLSAHGRSQIPFDSHEIVEQNLTFDEARALETYLILRYKEYLPYNDAKQGLSFSTSIQGWDLAKQWAEDVWGTRSIP